jgi:uncharacterized protein (TIGR00369 family)
VITDEPVRGRTPPPWLRALSGIERQRAFSRGLLPWPPLARLLGMRTTHVAAGTVTIAMPAAEASLTPNGQLQFIPLMMRALEGASGTALPGGMDVVPLRFTIDPFRPAWPRPGNLLARARVVNSGNLYVFAEVQVDDPDGRHIAQGLLHSVIQRVEPAPPPPPETMQPVEEPVYETPDPYLRSFASSPFADIADREDGLTTVRKVADGRLRSPFHTLYGFHSEEFAVGRAVMSMPASEWFCDLGSDVSWSVIAALADSANWMAAITLHQPGQSMVGLDGIVRFLRPVRADGRPMRAEAVLTEPVPNLFVGDTKICDADGRLVAMSSGSVARLDAAQRTGRRRKESRRVLATLLFTDIVDSTGHAQRLGDARWRAMLEEYKLTVRREVSRHNGTEVDTAGDGFFVRFDSPAHAIEAARAARQATAPLGIEIRAGIHTGECELEGNRLAGMAVHIAARIQTAAQPGEILVSSTVRDLAVGSTIRFADKGEQTLKGVPDPWRLYAVVD